MYVRFSPLPLNDVAVIIPEVFIDAALSIAYAVAAAVEVDAVPVKFPTNVVAVMIPVALTFEHS